MESKGRDSSSSLSEVGYSLLVHGVTDYAIYMLDRDGMVTSWNVGAERIKGYRPDEVIGTNFSRFYRPEDQESGLPEMALAVAARDGSYVSEGWRVRKDDSQFWADVVIDPLRDSAGELVGFAKVTRDVTERRNAAQAREWARDAIQLRKLDELARLTDGAAHDFRNVLSIIVNSLELVRRYIPDDDKLKRFVGIALKGAGRGVLLAQRMLTFARQQHLNLTAVHLPPLVEGMRNMLELMVGGRIHIETCFEAGLKAALTDADQLELAVLNLVANARDAMPTGGCISITAREKTLSAMSAKMMPGQYVCLSFTDTGTGMSKKTLARADEPFFTTKDVGKGTGLGLPMVYGLAAQSGGRVVLLSTEGLGTTVELWLPVAHIGIDTVSEIPVLV